MARMRSPVKLRICTLFIFLATLVVVSLFAVSRYSSAGENPCLTCHADFKQRVKSVHAAMALGCQTCHKQVEGKSHPDQKGSIKLTQDMPGLCFSCHDESKFKGKSIHAPITGGMCTGCHNPHQSNFAKILVKDVPGLCYNCHDESKFKGKSGHTAIGMCTSCHNPHASNSDKILISNIPDLCYTCHEKEKFTKKYVHSIIPVGGCNACHTPHTTTNPSLLLKPTEELCVSCHAAKSDGRHIVSLPGKKVHPVKGIDPTTRKHIRVPDPKHPGQELEIVDPKNPGTEFSCTSCHNPHSSDYEKLFPQKNICSKCHQYY